MALYTMKEILGDAMAKKYGVGFFNVVNLDMARACIDAAQECGSPIIIGTAEGLLNYAGFEWIAPLMLRQARRAAVPVAVHLDHAYSFDVLMQALRRGFGSVMFDGTRLESVRANIRESAKIAGICHAMGVGLECELGSVGGLSDETGKADELVYTDPNQAKEFVRESGADFLAVSIGTQHGVYKAEPKLDFERLKEIRAAVDIPLVLHGGSGLSDDDFKRAIADGISKINVFTDVILAAKQAVAQHPELGYMDALAAAENAMRNAVKEKLEIFGSCGKA